ncbi:MAG: bile acid-coenzyme A ligase [Candidatus Azotimanducaceae bacterium]|jgi:bile acid-coenzyme A ligase
MTLISLSKMLAYWVDIQADTIAISHESESITWAALESETNQLARAYAAQGVKANDFVTIALPNGLEFFKACFATWKLGATPQPVSAKLPLFELNQIIELCEPSLVIGVDMDSAIPINYKDHLSFSDEPLPELIAASFKAMTSGGSTGRPKLIVSATPAVWDIDLEYLQIKRQGAMLIPGPLYHNGPFSWAMIALFRGNHVCVTSRFDAEETLSLIQEHLIDIVYMVPTMMQRIWKLEETVRLKYDLSCLETLWHLAAPCPAWLKQAFIDWLGPEVIWELYGGTEGQGSTIISGTEWLLHKGSVGLPGAACEMKIVSEEGETLKANEIGEVFIRPLTGQGSTYHYIGAEAKSIEGGWESLGDMGYMDTDGYLYLADRQTDMILSGGANIYPAEIEAAIDAFKGIRSSAVIGLPHEDLGSVIHAIVDSPSVVDEAELLVHLAERLTKYKIPRTIEWVSEPLRDDAGKLRRKQLRAERVINQA